MAAMATAYDPAKVLNGIESPFFHCTIMESESTDSSTLLKGICRLFKQNLTSGGVMLHRLVVSEAMVPQQQTVTNGYP